MDINEILERLDHLAGSWRTFLELEPLGDAVGSFRAGVDNCATQLERTLAKIRQEIANG